MALLPPNAERQPGSVAGRGHGLRAALEAEELALRLVDEDEIHDADNAYLARLTYVASYLRLWDILRTPAENFAQKLAIGKLGLATIAHAEKTNLSILQIGRSTVADAKLVSNIDKLKKQIDTLAEVKAQQIVEARGTKGAT